MIDSDTNDRLTKELEENKLLLERILKLYFDKRKLLEENENSILNLTNYKYKLNKDYTDFINKKMHFMKKVSSFISIPIIFISLFFTFYFLNTNDISLLFLFISCMTFISYNIFIDFIETYTYLYEKIFINNEEFKNIIQSLKKVKEQLDVYIGKSSELTSELQIIYSDYYSQKNKIKSIEYDIEQLVITSIDNMVNLDYKEKETPFVKVKKKN